MTRAELLAEHIGMTQETHPECYKSVWLCKTCGKGAFACRCAEWSAKKIYTFDLPDPMRSGHEVDRWLGPLIDHLGAVNFLRYAADLWGVRIAAPAHVAAIINVMLAADPAFRAKWETRDEVPSAEAAQ